MFLLKEASFSAINFEFSETSPSIFNLEINLTFPCTNNFVFTVVSFSTFKVLFN